MATGVTGEHTGYIFDPITGIERATTVIDVFEPHRLKALVKPPQPLPDVAARHEKRSSGLFHWSRQIKIPIQTSIPAINRVITP